MKKFEAINKRNENTVVITYLENGVISVKDQDGKEKEVKEATIKRWYVIGKEIKPKKKVKQKAAKKPVGQDKRKKLTEEEVIEIRTKFQAGQSKASLAREYGMSYSGLHWVVNGNTWKNVNVG